MASPMFISGRFSKASEPGPLDRIDLSPSVARGRDNNANEEEGRGTEGSNEDLPGYSCTWPRATTLGLCVTAGGHTVRPCVQTQHAGVGYRPDNDLDDGNLVRVRQRLLIPEQGPNVGRGENTAPRSRTRKLAAADPGTKGSIWTSARAGAISPGDAQLVITSHVLPGWCAREAALPLGWSVIQ